MCATKLMDWFLDTSLAARKVRSRAVAIAPHAFAVASILMLAVGSAVAFEVDKPLVIGLAGSTDSTTDKKDGKATGSETTKQAADASIESNASKNTAAPTVGSPEERSATALAFVREHHPDLVELLARLKGSNGVEYDKAIRELARTSDRLSVLRAKNPERYALELESWKLKSQIQLLSARASLAPNEDLTSELRALIERQLEVRAAQLELERSELAERLDRVEAALQTAETEHQSQLDKQLNDVLRGIEVARKREADRRANKPAATAKNKRDNKKDGKKSPKADAKKDGKAAEKQEAKQDKDK